MYELKSYKQLASILSSRITRTEFFANGVGRLVTADGTPIEEVEETPKKVYQEIYNIGLKPNGKFVRETVIGSRLYGETISKTQEELSTLDTIPAKMFKKHAVRRLKRLDKFA